MNLGSTPVSSGKFTITDAAIAATSKVLVWQAPGPYTGKGSALSADEGAMDPIHVAIVIPGTGSAVVHWGTTLGLRPVTPAFVGGRINAQAVTTVAGMPVRGDLATFAARAGVVKGNIKFSYIVFS